VKQLLVRHAAPSRLEVCLDHPDQGGLLARTRLTALVN